MSRKERRLIRDAVTEAARITGAVRLECPDQRCWYVVTCKDRARAEADLADHLADDPRHTDSEWIDRDGVERIGLRDRAIQRIRDTP